MIEKTINKRYKQFSHDEEKYLLDMDSNKITWFLPFLVWFLPIKAYKNSQLPILKEKENKNGNGFIVLLASVLSAILIRVTAKGFGDLAVFSAYRYISFALLIGLMVCIFLIRYLWRYKGNKFSQTTNEIYYIKIDFYTGISGKIKYGYKIFILTVICYAIILYFSNFFLNVYQNIIVLPVILLVEYFVLIINTTILNPEKDYKIIITKK